MNSQNRSGRTFKEREKELKSLCYKAEDLLSILSSGTPGDKEEVVQDFNAVSHRIYDIIVEGAENNG